MATTSPNGSSERSLGQLFSDASRDLTALVHSEIALAKSELKDDVKAAAKGGGMFGAAGVLGFVAFILLSIAAAYGLVAAGLHPGFAFLIVAVVYLVLAAILALVGRSRSSAWARPYAPSRRPRRAWPRSRARRRPRAGRPAPARARRLRPAPAALGHAGSVRRLRSCQGSPRRT
jgi:hypothetical protein